jgi:hypothetical protein
VQASRRGSDALHGMTVPSSVTGPHHTANPHSESRADLALQYPPAPGSDPSLISSTVLQTGMTSPGNHTSHTVTTQVTRGPNGRKGSNIGKGNRSSSLMDSPPLERSIRSRDRDSNRLRKNLPLPFAN